MRDGNSSGFGGCGLLGRKSSSSSEGSNSSATVSLSGVVGGVRRVGGSLGHSFLAAARRLLALVAAALDIRLGGCRFLVLRLYLGVVDKVVGNDWRCTFPVRSVGTVSWLCSSMVVVC